MRRFYVSEEKRVRVDAKTYTDVHVHEARLQEARQIPIGRVHCATFVVSCLAVCVLWRTRCGKKGTCVIDDVTGLYGIEL